MSKPIGLTLKGEQGSGKTRLLKIINEALTEKGFETFVFDEIHGLNICNPLETLDKLEGKN